MDKTKAIHRAEAALIALFLLSLILPQVIGSKESAVQGSPTESAGDISAAADLQDKRRITVCG